MCDDNGRPAFHQVLKCLLNERFRFGIERRRRFIENQDGRILQQRSCDGNALAFAARKTLAAFADGGCRNPVTKSSTSAALAA